MSFSLKSIELNNIRAHEHFVFEPAMTGVTAISGDNGAGKSTIVDSLAWALYGTRPSGVRNKNLIKEGVDPREKPVGVKVRLIVGGDGGVEYIIERKLINKHGSTECNVWGKTSDAFEFNHVAGPAVSHVEKFIRQELGMNEKGFLTSVLIQQKQVDQIVSASPRERGEVIEELTGIASITQAISKTNEMTRALQKAASVMQTGDIDAAEERVNKQRELCESLIAKEESAVTQFADAKAKFKADEALVREEGVKVDKRIELTTKVEGLKKQVSFLKQQAKDDIEYIAAHKEKYGTTRSIDVNKHRELVDDKRGLISEIELSISKLKMEIEQHNDTINKCDILIGDYQDKTIDTEIAKIEEMLSEAQQLQSKLSDEKSITSSEVKNSKKSHSHLDGDNTNCPVCKHEIEDPEALLKEIEDDIKSLQAKEKDLIKKLKGATAKVKEHEDTLKNANIAREAIAAKMEAEANLEKAEADLESKANELALERVELSALEVEYRKALKVEADKEALDGAKKRSLTVNTTIREFEEDIKSTEEEIEALGAMNDRSYTALVNRVKKDQAHLTKMSIAGREIQGRRRLEQERLQDYEKQLANEERILKEYENIAQQIQTHTSASSMLTQFKADRIENSIPTLEFFASDFLSKFTGGSFVKLSLDEKFNTFVTTDTGTVRPIAQLSGGELSSAAIALRLGIAMLLNSNEKNVLILDEVLVSMDEDRARQIMETIGSMTNSQVIFIAHNSDINSVADKTILVERK